MNSNYQIAAYYFPNFHLDPRNEVWHGKGWTEWNLVRAAAPRFEGHVQPKVPAWGYEDESDPAVMAKKIDAAARSGLSAFLFDWYWYDNGPYLQRALEEGFLKAENRGDLKFALMWANHDWLDIHPAQRSRPCNVLATGKVSVRQFEEATDYILEHYFTQPNYWRVDGGLSFSIYELAGLVQGLGGVAGTRAALDGLRDRVRKRGLGELHLNAVIWGVQILPAEIKIENPNALLEALGFDSVTSYVWIHHRTPPAFPAADYSAYARDCLEESRRLAGSYRLPYYPNVTMGWDPSPRTIQSDAYENTGYPATPILSANTPAAFRKALEGARSLLDETAGPRILTINAWNEWTEGSYLEPDTVNGWGYLDAIREVFSR